MKYHDIELCSVENGIGFRISLFVSGCNFHCKNCFNKETWDFDSGKEFTESKQSELKQYLQLPYIAGLSLLGGDPLCQSKEDIQTLINLCKYTHSLNKNVWLWSGFTWEELLNAEPTGISEARLGLINNSDVFVDGRYIDEQRDLSLKWRGSKNQRVIDIDKSIQSGKIVLFCD